MDKRLLPALPIVFMGLFLAACQSLPFYSFAGGETVAPQDMIALDQGQQTGEWKGEYLTVDYKLAGNDLSGTARFNSNIAINYQFLREFRMTAVFTGRDGRILGSQGLATNRGDFDPIPFHTRLAPPPGTVGLAFGYTGTGLNAGDDEGGSGGLTSFWQYTTR